MWIKIELSHGPLSVLSFSKDKRVYLEGKSQVYDIGLLLVWVLNQRHKCTIMAHLSMYFTNPKGST